MYEDEYVKQIKVKPQLKPCPFCGEAAIVLIHKGLKENESPGCQENALKGLFYVGCPEDTLNYHICDVKPSASWFADLNKAIEVWNIRKGGK